MHPVEFTFYKAIILIVSAMAIAVGITNMIYFNKIRLNDNCSEVSPNTANILTWLNLILVILSFVLFFWSLFRLIFPTGLSKTVVHKSYNTYIHSETVPSIPIASPVPQSCVLTTP